MATNLKVIAQTPLDDQVINAGNAPDIYFQKKALLGHQLIEKERSKTGSTFHQRCFNEVNFSEQILMT